MKNARRDRRWFTAEGSRRLHRRPHRHALRLHQAREEPAAVQAVHRHGRTDFPKTNSSNGPMARPKKDDLKCSACRSRSDRPERCGRFCSRTKKMAGEPYNAYVGIKAGEAVSDMLIGTDDFGQSLCHSDGRNPRRADRRPRPDRTRPHPARPGRRTRQSEVHQAATDDPIIKAAMRPQGPGVLTPMGGFRQN